MAHRHGIYCRCTSIKRKGTSNKITIKTRKHNHERSRVGVVPFALPFIIINIHSNWATNKIKNKEINPKMSRYGTKQKHCALYAATPQIKCRTKVHEIVHT